jgi:GDPmannose 4,6-dehydratase
MAHQVLITGIEGQDGSYLAEQLLARGDRVTGLVYSGVPLPPVDLAHLDGNPEMRERLRYVSGDILDRSLFHALLSEVKPDLIFHLEAVSSVALSFQNPLLTAEINGAGTLRLLEAARLAVPRARLFLAISGEVFGPTEAPADERTDLRPTNPYAASKAMAYWAGVNYRESYGLYISNGLLFNHESPRRAQRFLTRKVARGVAEIVKGKRDKLALGNLNPIRDWGYAPEYMEAVVKMLDAPAPADYVVATGVAHSVRDYVEAAFETASLNYRDYVVQDPAFMRPSDLPRCVGNPARIAKDLGWKAKTDFKGLVKILMDAEWEKLA